jgi:hypothetical protein
MSYVETWREFFPAARFRSLGGSWSHEAIAAGDYMSARATPEGKVAHEEDDAGAVGTPVAFWILNDETIIRVFPRRTGRIRPTTFAAVGKGAI